MTSIVNASLVLLFIAAPKVWAALIPLKSSWTPAADQAPPFYIWQNDPGLTEYLTSGGVTGLCVPSAISNALIYEYAFQNNPATALKLPGLTVNAKGEPAVDSNSIIRYFAKACHYTPDLGTPLSDGANCIAQFYRESGYLNAKVKMIRRNVYALDASVNYEDRLPTLQDIRQGLDQGYKVLASIVMMKWNGNEWIKTGSHSFNVYGIVDHQLVISNPTRAYSMNFIDSVFDLGAYDENPVLPSQALPEPYSTIQLHGRLIDRPGSMTFLAGLTLIKAQ